MLSRSLTICYLLLFFSRPIFADGFVIIDLDGTAFANSAEHDGSFDTPMILFRLQDIGPYAPRINDLPETIELSPADYRRVTKSGFLGLGEGRPGSMKSITVDGNKIYPGYYWIDPTRSYKYFREDGKKNHFLDTARKAIEAKKDWRGPSWSAVKLMLSKETLRDRLIIATARGHDPSDIVSGFKALQADHPFKLLPNTKNIYAFSRPEHRSLVPSGNPMDGKVNLLVRLADHLRNVPLDPEEDLILSATKKGKKLMALHTIAMHENDPKALVQIRDKMVTLARSGQYPIKFVLVDRSLVSEFRENKEPYQFRASVILPDGRFRQATKAEVIGLNDREAKEMSCFSIGL